MKDLTHKWPNLVSKNLDKAQEEVRDAAFDAQMGMMESPIKQR